MAKYQAQYAMNAHDTIAIAQGITQYKIDTILEGQMPNTLDRQGQVIYNGTYKLIHGQGPLRRKLGQACIDVFR